VHAGNRRSVCVGIRMWTEKKASRQEASRQQAKTLTDLARPKTRPTRPGGEEAPRRL
jgi:hypothetical protein